MLGLYAAERLIATKQYADVGVWKSRKPESGIGTEWEQEPEPEPETAT